MGCRGDVLLIGLHRRIHVEAAFSEGVQLNKSPFEVFCTETITLMEGANQHWPQRMSIPIEIVTV